MTLNYKFPTLLVSTVPTSSPAAALVLATGKLLFIFPLPLYQR